MKKIVNLLSTYKKENLSVSFSQFDDLSTKITVHWIGKKVSLIKEELVSTTQLISNFHLIEDGFVFNIKNAIEKSKV